MNKRILHSVFENQVAKTPENIAIECVEGKITYRQLNQEANLLAHLLKELAVGRGTVAASFMPPGSNLVKSFLAIQKSGAIYMPMDIAFAVNHTLTILEEIKPDCAIVSSFWWDDMKEEVKEKLKSTKSLVVIGSKAVLVHTGGDEREIKLSNYPTENPQNVSEPADGNYIFHTSGSTGKPKAILGCHDSLSHFIHWEKNEFDIKESFRVAQLSNVTFDASLRDIFLPLIVGGTLCVPPLDIKSNVPLLVKWIQRSSITLIHSVPSFFRRITQHIDTREKIFPDLQFVLLAGEPLYNQDVNTWYERVGKHAQLVNLYGTSESTLAKTFHRVEKVGGNPSQIVHVGKPISNTLALVLGDGILCAPGEIGEIYILTPFLTKGYYNDEERTKEIFVQNPLTDRQEVIHRTGDYGRFDKERNLEVLGRKDEQVKINGVRVELGEVRQAILNVDGIEAVEVIVHQKDLEKELIAYYIGPSVEEDTFREQVSHKLNQYVIPSYFIRMEAFPLTLNGKVDKRGLPKPEALILDDSDYQPVKGAVETRLETIWQEVLGLERIGRKVSFFKIGGTSLKAIRVISDIYHSFGVNVLLAEFFRQPSIAALATLVASRPQHEPDEIVPVASQPYYEVSHAQKGVWLVEQSRDTGGLYNMSSTYQLTGRLSQEGLQAALDALALRHETLRTTFKEVDGELCQKIHPAEVYGSSLEWLDVKDFSSPDEVILDRISSEKRQSFDLHQGPLYKIIVFHKAEGQYVLFFNIHHIICDGWSLEVFSDELIRLYEGAVGLKPVVIPPLSIQYKDFAHWHNNRLANAISHDSPQYWREVLQDASFRIGFPTDYSPGSRPTAGGGQYVFKLEKDQSTHLINLLKQEGCSLYMGSLTLVNLLLYARTGNTDVLVGSPFAGRLHKGLESQIGLFVNVLLLRTRIHEDQSFQRLLLETKFQVLKASEHQYWPFDRTLEEISAGEEQVRLSSLEVLVQSQDMVGEKELETEDFDIEVFPTEHQTSKVALTFNFKEEGDRILVGIEYDKGLFKQSSIERIGHELSYLVDRVLADSHSDVAHLKKELVDYYSSRFQASMIEKMRSCASERRVHQAVHTIFERNTEAFPDRVAIEEPEGTMTYGALNEHANRLAHRLMGLGLKPGACVGMTIPSGKSMVSSVLSIFKSGGIYVPLDISFSPKRIKAMLADCDIHYLLVSTEDVRAAQILVETHYKQKESIFIVDVSEFTVYRYEDGTFQQQNMDAGSAVNPPTAQVDHSYIIYTSGSTGVAKPILGSHNSLSHFIQWELAEFAIHSSDRVSQLSQFTFDASLRDVFVPLLSGATLVIPPPDSKSNVGALAKWLTGSKVSIIHTVPSFFRLLSKDLARVGERVNSIRYVLLAGEVLYGKDVKDWQAIVTGGELVNLFGTSETTLAKTCYRTGKFTGHAHEMVQVGKPIADTCIVIANQGRLCAPGEVGEVYIQTPYLSKGYYQRPAPSAEVLVDHPIASLAGRTVHRTGDYGRYRDDGSVEILGRKDEQVKINGIRVELGEVKQAVLEVSGIQEVEVLAHKNPSDQLELVVYYTGKPYDIGELRNALRASLNDPLIPSYFIRMEAFPLTLNGKVDKRGLPKPEALILDDSDYQPVKGAVEARLETIWQEVLGLERIGRKVSFFKIGGTSLKAIRVISDIYHSFGVNVLLAEFFRQPSIAALATLVASRPQHEPDEIVPVASQPYYEVSHAQKRLWILDRLFDLKQAYNIVECYRITSDLNVEAFRKAVEHIVKCYEILRTTFTYVDHELRQVIHDRAIDNPLSYECISAEEKIIELASKDADTPFDIENGPLFKAKLIKQEQEYFFILVVHHIIFDGWSMKVLNAQLQRQYQHYVNGGTHAPFKPALQYKDYASWHNKMLVSEKGMSLRTYWMQKFEPGIPALNLITDYPREKASGVSRGTANDLFLEKEVCSNLRDLAKENDTSFFTILTLATSILLNKYTGQHDLIIGVPSSGREYSQLEEQIGFFVNTLPLRIALGEEESIRDILQQVKQTMLEAQEHEAYPFDRLVEELNINLNQKRNPLFDVMLVLEEDLPETVQESDTLGLQFSQVKVPFEYSRYDLTFHCTEVDNGLYINLIYNRDLFKPWRIKNMLSTLRSILSVLKDQFYQPLSALDYLPTDHKQWLDRLNETAYSYPNGKTMAQIFEENASKHPDAVCVVFEEETLTYQEVNERANQLASYLISSVQIGHEDIVAINLEPSEWLVPLMLGILKSGAAFLPIDPDLPEDRINYIIEDAAAKTIITQKPNAKLKHERVLTIEDIWQEAGKLSTQNSQPVATPASLGYVIYTSGSTGKPKGVQIEQYSNINMASDQVRRFGIMPVDNLLQFASISFDAMIYEAFNALYAGATVVHVAKSIIKDLRHFEQYIKEKKVSIVTLPPSYLERLNKNKLDFLRVIITAGESAIRQDALQCAQSLNYYNAYGPTECAVCTTVHPVDPSAYYPLGIPIGRPIANTKVLLLDKYQRQVPIGAKGEICIVGDGVARGYINQQEKTRQVFSKEPLGLCRMYKTGDFGTLNEAGEILFIGREDFQVKIRGYRIELGEIERVLMEHHAITNVAVRLTSDPSGDDLLIAGLKGDIEQEERVKAWVARKLPDYMIPSIYLWLDEFPLNTSGKIDTGALLDLVSLAGMPSRRLAKPKNELEEEILSIWKMVFNTSEIDTHDNFFTIGGNSLKVIRILEIFQCEYPGAMKVGDLFDNPTIVLQARKLQEEMAQTEEKDINVMDW